MGLFSRRKKVKDAARFTSSQVAASLMNNTANSSNEAYMGMDLLRSEGEKIINKLPEIKQGNLFEIIERTKFNMDAASKGSTLRAVTTAELGRPHDPVDILIRNKGKVVEEVQAKSSKKATYAANYMRHKKYDGMQKLVNSDKAERAKELSQDRANTASMYADEYADSAKNITGELHHGDISSKGTNYDEAMSAANDYESYANQFEKAQFKRELGQSIKTSAVASSVVGGGISLIKNSIAYGKEEISGDELLGNVVLDTGKAAARGGATGGVSTVIRTAAQKSGNLALAKTNVATSIAAGVIDVGITVVSYAKGEIDSEQAMIQVGEKGFNTMSSVYAGMTAGAMFGPAGALVGSLVGYMLASNVYQTCVDTFKHSKLRQDEAYRLILLYDESIKVMKEERENFERYIEERLNRNEGEFKKLINGFEKGLKDNNLGDAIYCMSDLANYFGKELKYIEFDDFDEAMKSEEPLVL